MAEHAATAYLDLADDDTSVDDGYNSEARELHEFDRRKKRRRLSHDEDAEFIAEEVPSKYARKFERKEDKSSGTFTPSPYLFTSEHSGLMTASEPVKVSTLQSNTARASSGGKSLLRQSRSAKSGVIYLSRVPPFLKPSALRSLLSPYGELGRVFLTPEEPLQYAARVKAGGNKKRSFTDGWVEFKRKRDAKLVAEALNAQNIGGKKGGWYHDDVWNIKYLKGFKWHHLTEQISNENAERAARLRTEIAQTRRENRRFVTNVERAKMLDTMQQKQKRKAKDDDSQHQEVVPIADHRKHDTHFEQVKVKTKKRSLDHDPKSLASVNNVLNQIF